MTTIFPGFRELTDAEYDMIALASTGPVPAGLCHCAICGKRPLISDEWAAAEGKPVISTAPCEHDWTGWVLEAIASRTLPDRVRSCRLCGKGEREALSSVNPPEPYYAWANISPFVA